MKDLEGRFGKKHPALENFKEPHPAFTWMVPAFFRLNSRRLNSEVGPQPISLNEIHQYAEAVLNLDKQLQPLFFRTIESADNAVLSDHYEGVKNAREEQERKLQEKKTRHPR